MNNVSPNDFLTDMETFTAVFDCLSEGIIILDKKLNIQAINLYTSNIFKSNIEELVGTSIEDIIEDVDFKNKIHNLINSPTSYNKIIKEEVVFSIKNFDIRCILNVMPIIKLSKLNGIVITVTRALSNSVGYKATYTFNDIITENATMFKIMHYAKKAAATDCSILLEGYSGTGKEVFAQSIHNHSARKNGPFIAVNCSAIPRELMESELFGYERGAFTGASKNGYPGKFELADGGTIFLDEIGELPLDLQSKLLRVLDNYKISRIGGNHEKSLDIRVISATNRVLAEEVNKKNFRLDLYYRINVISIHLMKLEDRKEDIEALADYFIYKLNLKNPQRPKRGSDAYMDKLKGYNWPGNVRELRNIVERSYYLCDGNIITDAYITQNLSSQNNEAITKIFPTEVISMKEMEKICIENALKKTNGSVDKAAELLGISRATIYRKLRE